MDRMLVFADLHLREENADLALRTVLPGLVTLAKNHGCKDIACLGDFWKVRHMIPVWLLNEVRDRLRHWVEKDGVEFFLLSGNHDQVDVPGRNALESLSGPGVHVYSDATADKHGLWVPYRKDREQQLEMIEHFTGSPWDARSSILFGHFGVVGAQVAGLGEMAEGIPPKVLWPFKRVILGHYHRPQGIGVVQSNGGCHVEYIGSPYHIDAGESNETKRVLFLDDNGLSSYPIVVGPRYWKLAAASGEQLEQTLQMLGAASGDIVNAEVPEGAHLEQMAAVLHARGIAQHTLTHRVSVVPPRLQVTATSAAGPTFEDYFRAMLDLRSAVEQERLPADQMLAEFRAIQSEAAK